MLRKSESNDIKLESFEIEGDKFKKRIGNKILRMLRSDLFAKKVKIIEGGKDITVIKYRVGQGHAAYVFNPYCSKLETGHTSSSNPVATNIDISAMPKKHQKYIIGLCDVLSSSENCFDLWYQTKLKLKEMPGWWSFFDNFRALTLELTKLLNNYQKFDLKHTDIKYLNMLTATLIRYIKQLKDEITKLKRTCDEVIRENKGLKDTSNEDKISGKLKFSKKQTEHLKSENKKLVSTVQVIQAENDRLLNENKKHKGEKEGDEKKFNALKRQYDLMKEQNLRLVNAVNELQEQIDELEDPFKIVQEGNFKPSHNNEEATKEIDNKNLDQSETLIEIGKSKMDEKNNTLLKQTDETEDKTHTVKNRLQDDRVQGSFARNPQILWKAKSADVTSINNLHVKNEADANLQATKNIESGDMVIVKCVSGSR